MIYQNSCHSGDGSTQSTQSLKLNFAQSTQRKTAYNKTMYKTSEKCLSLNRRTHKMEARARRLGPVIKRIVIPFTTSCSTFYMNFRILRRKVFSEHFVQRTPQVKHVHDKSGLEHTATNTSDSIAHQLHTECDIHV